MICNGNIICPPTCVHTHKHIITHMSDASATSLRQAAQSSLSLEAAGYLEEALQRAHRPPAVSTR